MMKTYGLLALALSALVAGPTAYGQWEQVPDKRIPRTSTGEADLDAPAPRTADGKPSLAGVWMVRSRNGAADGSPSAYMIDVTADYGPEELQLEPWAAEQFQQRRATSSVNNPQAHCRPTGLPFINTVLLPLKIVQTPDVVYILYEENRVFRQVFLDGRKPVEDPLLRWYGYSTGTWEGDTLVVETTGLTADSWLDEWGHPHSDSMRVVERFSRPVAGTLNIETTIDDLETYSQAFSYTVSFEAVADDELFEYFCQDNEASIEHYYYPDP